MAYLDPRVFMMLLSRLIIRKISRTLCSVMKVIRVRLLRNRSNMSAILLVFLSSFFRTHAYIVVRHWRHHLGPLFQLRSRARKINVPRLCLVHPSLNNILRRLPNRQPRVPIERTPLPIYSSRSHPSRNRLNHHIQSPQGPLHLRKLP